MEYFEHADGGLDFDERIAGDADADGVAETFGQERADAQGAFEDGFLARSGGGDAEVQGAVAGDGDGAIGGDGGGNVAGLEGKDEVAEAARLEEVEVTENFADHAIGDLLRRMLRGDGFRR